MNAHRYNSLNAYTVHVPKYFKDRMRKLAVFKQEYITVHHKEPTSEEIQSALHISARSLCHLEKSLFNLNTKSLDDYVSSDGDTKLIDLLASDEKIDEFAGGSEYHKELYEELESALTILDQKTALMIRCVFYQRQGHKQHGLISCRLPSLYTGCSP